MIENMKHDNNWDTASTSYDTLEFMALIEKTILAKTEYQYPFTTVYEQEVEFYNFNQQNLTNDQWEVQHQGRYRINLWSHKTT